MKRIALMTVALLAAAVHVAEAAPMTTYRDAKIQARVPSGWKVTVNHQAGVLVAQQNPRSKTSPTILVTMKGFQANVSALAILNTAFQNMGGKVRILNRQVEQGGNAVQVVAQLRKNNMTIHVGALAMVSAAQGRSIFAAFMGFKPAFDRFGGMKTLHAVTFSIRPAQMTATKPTLRRKPNYTKLPRNKLVGSWRQVGIGGMMNRYDMNGRVTSTDMRGSGTMYRFTRNKYTVIYTSKARTGMCTSKANMTESGRYSYDGTTLTLRPFRYQGTLCTCCSGRKPSRVSKRIPKRSYRVFGIANQRGLILRGTCAPYMVDAGCSSTAALIKGKGHDIVRDFTLR